MAGTADGLGQQGVRALLDALPDAVLLASGDGRCLWGNAALAALLGHPVEELRRHSVVDLLGIEAGGWHEGWSGETEAHHHDGSTVPVEARFSAVSAAALPGVLDAAGGAVGRADGALCIGALRDVSHWRRAERRRHEFLAMVSHELKNPLTSIRGFAQQLRRRREHSDEALGVIMVQVDRLGRLIDDLLDVSRLEARRLRLRPRDVDLAGLVRNVAAQAQALTRLHAVSVEAPEAPVVGRWDGHRLEQVLQNLLSNAIKYAPDGGEILVRLEDLGAEARVSVTDQGAGVPPDALARVFQRFYRAETEGTGAAGALGDAGGPGGAGIGLYVSKALVEAHGGRIWAESEVGRGSTFTFTLPVRDEKLAQCRPEA